MTGRAEFRAQEGGGSRHPAVGQLGPWGAIGRGPVTARRAEGLVLPHVTARADDAASPEARVEAGIGNELPVDHNLPTLLGDRGMAARARAGGGRLAPDHLHELSRDARAHALRVQRGLPVAELHGMARPTGLRLDRALDRREAGRRRPELRNRSAPVTADGGAASRRWIAA